MVQEYFQSRGYEPAVCDCFSRHKITGAILLELDLAYLKEIDISSFGTRFEISKDIKHLNQIVRNATNFPHPMSHTSSQPSHDSHLPPKINTSLSTESSHASNTLMAPPTFRRQSVLRATKDTSAGNQLPSYSQSPKNPSIKTASHEPNAHTRDSSFDPNWVHPATLKQQQELEHHTHSSYSDERTIRTPQAQMGGRFRSSTISTTDQYYIDNHPSPDVPIPPQPFPIRARHSQSFSNGSNPGQSRKSSYVEDTRLRHNTHSRETSYDTVLGQQEGGIYMTPKHAHSTSSLGIDYKVLAPYTNGYIPDAFEEVDEDYAPPVKEMKDRRRSSVIAALVKPLPLLKKDMVDPPESPRSRKEAEVGDESKEKRIGTDPIMKTATPDPEDAPKRAATDGSKKKPALRTTSSQTNIRSKTFASSKQKTSAFQEGINSVSPAEASKTADFAGWMSKRGSVAVGTWKTRFFCLHGTRLSYFTSFSDTRERGLIDITSHRVVPVGDSDDKFVALYAASVGAGRHCFKVVPPSPGSRKGVTFTIPKVHYFAVETREEMRAWMAALMKATIDRDDSVPIVSSCATPTIPLSKAQELQAEARAKEEQVRNQFIAASKGSTDVYGNPRQGNGTWLNGFGFGGDNEPSTPDSPTTSSSIRSSGTGSSNTAASVNKSTKGGQQLDYFSPIPVSSSPGLGH